jgi:hypothetical protein
MLDTLISTMRANKRLAKECSLSNIMVCFSYNNINIKQKENWNAPNMHSWNYSH